jgi:hypothetical protein
MTVNKLATNRIRSLIRFSSKSAPYLDLIRCPIRYQKNTLNYLKFLKKD